MTMSFNNPTHNQDLFIFQFLDTANLVNFSKKITNLFQFTPKEHIYPQKILFFWVKKTTKVFGREKSQPTTS
jgi:hypothetical protein